ncbi:hypothetical protein [Pseudomonas sp. BIGb0278]|uniref:hypothetical protein n=1 Tax=Pseudomonas sp. BIGb0278 TaxID=2940607 RepID=UPI00216920DA|nr:hypothetical protein [Pseudomonas sp. BIGb0278]
MLDLLLCMNEARSVAGTLEALLRAIKNPAQWPGFGSSFLTRKKDKIEVNVCHSATNRQAAIF